MACRSSRAVSGVTPHGAMSRQAVLSWPSSATVMSARRMNSSRGRLGWVAVLGDEGAPFLRNQRLIVHHEPVGLEPRITDLDAELGADGAVGPVSADEPPRPDLLRD